MTTTETENGSSAERRRYSRRAVEGVRGSFLLAADAKVVNMSLTGLALETATYLHVGRDYQVKLRFEEEALDLSGKIVWCTLVKTEKQPSGEVVPVYRAGVRFDSMLTEQGEQLANFLQSDSDARLAERITGRIRMPGRAGSELEVIVPFSVIELSASGMRIATPVRLEVDAQHPLELQFGSTEFATRARVVHCEGDPLGTHPMIAGIEFLEISDESREELQQLIIQQVIEL